MKLSALATDRVCLCPSVFLKNEKIRKEKMEKKLDKNGYPLMDSEALCQEALDLWGIDSQVWMAVEEMAELTNALCKMKRGRNNPEDIITEIADVQIMMEQLQLFFGKEEVDTERNRKLIRLHDRMCDYRAVHNQNCK